MAVVTHLQKYNYVSAFGLIAPVLFSVLPYSVLPWKHLTTTILANYIPEPLFSLLVSYLVSPWTDWYWRSMKGPYERAKPHKRVCLMADHKESRCQADKYPVTT
eukprot:UN20002